MSNNRVYPKGNLAGGGMFRACSAGSWIALGYLAKVGVAGSNPVVRSRTTAGHIQVKAAQIPPEYSYRDQGGSHAQPSAGSLLRIQIT